MAPAAIETTVGGALLVLGLVVPVVGMLAMLVARLGQHLHVGVGRHGHAHDSGFAVDQHPAALDPFVGLAARAQAHVGQAFVETNSIGARRGCAAGLGARCAPEVGWCGHRG